MGFRESDDCKTLTPRSTMQEWFTLLVVFKALAAEASYAIGEITPAEFLFNNFAFDRFGKTEVVDAEMNSEACVGDLVNLLLV